MRKHVEESVATGAAAGRGRGGRFSAGRKREVVMRLLRGEDLESVSRAVGITAARVLAPLAVDQAAIRCSCGHESVGHSAAPVSTSATRTRRVTRRAAKMSLMANRVLTRPACMAGVLVSRPNRNALCGRTKL